MTTVHSSVSFSTNTKSKCWLCAFFVFCTVRCCKVPPRQKSQSFKASSFTSFTRVVKSSRAPPRPSVSWHLEPWFQPLHLRWLTLTQKGGCYKTGTFTVKRTAEILHIRYIWTPLQCAYNIYHYRNNDMRQTNSMDSTCYRGLIHSGALILP